MTGMRLAGGCHCGRVRYAAEAAPFHETICHCRDCRLAFGAAAVAWFSVPRSAFRFTAGEPKTYRSSAGALRGFCADCGTSLTFEADGTPEELDVATATLDDPDLAPPRDHVRAAGRPRWDAIADGLPVFPGARG